MIRRPPRSTHCISSAASDVYKRQVQGEGNGKTPRKMVVLVPKVEKDVAVEWKPMRREEHLVQQFESGRMEKMTVLRNKAPSWNSALNAYVLNFFGRVTMPSVKNFQLINPEDGCVQCLTL
eukprot:TRINITY_DN1313_c0_g1_i9.p1 TRINITY_DN1313_c0_g1~~TRINITY_DN1313_c0_g1_i9.p1  ORF type:complete len:129 (+),score=52.05 TRINITY_DN1313_c0_g1_i9:25-387(+)